jgi:hypothetical protein
MHRLRRAWPQWAVAAILLAWLLWAACAPLRYPSHERLVDFAKGSHARPVAGGQGAPLREVRLTLGAQDVLLLRNSDTEPLSFGPVQIMPGKDFRLPFDQASETTFACSACPGGQMIVRVVPLPDPGWERLRWRLDAVVHAIRFLPRQGPASS